MLAFSDAGSGLALRRRRCSTPFITFFIVHSISAVLFSLVPFYSAPYLLPSSTIPIRLGSLWLYSSTITIFTFISAARCLHPLRSRNAISTHRIRHRFSSSVRTVKAPTPDLSLPLTALTIDRGPPVGHRNVPTTGVNFDMRASTVYKSGSSDIAMAFACDCVWLGQAHILAYESPISNPVQLTFTFIVRELCLRHLSTSTPPLDITGFLASSPVLPTPFLFAVSTMQECGFARFDHYVIAASLSHYVCFKHDGSSQSRICG